MYPFTKNQRTRGSKSQMMNWSLRESGSSPLKEYIKDYDDEYVKPKMKCANVQSGTVQYKAAKSTIYGTDSTSDGMKRPSLPCTLRRRSNSRAESRPTSKYALNKAKNLDCMAQMREDQNNAKS